MKRPGWLLILASGTRAALALAAPDGGANATPGGCPADVDVRRELGVDGKGWVVACHSETPGNRELAALFDSGKIGEAPHLVISTLSGKSTFRAEFDLSGPEGNQIRNIPAAEWHLSVGPAKVRGVEWLRVDAVGVGGEDLFSAQDVVSFLRLRPDGLRRVWIGLGDRTEVRFDACRLETSARFSLAPDGKLVRARRSTRRFRNPGGILKDVLMGLKRECVAPKPTRDAFTPDA